MRDSPLDYWDANRYPESYLLLGLSEKQVQGMVVSTLRSRGCLVAVVDAGAAKLRGRAYAALVRAGTRDPWRLLQGQTGAGSAGLPDIIGCDPSGRFIAIEVKAPAWYIESRKTKRLVIERAAGEATGSQLDFIRKARERGAITGVVWHPLDLNPLLTTLPSQAASSTEPGAGGPPRSTTERTNPIKSQMQETSVKTLRGARSNRLKPLDIRPARRGGSNEPTTNES